MALIWLPELTNWCRKVTSALLLQVWHTFCVNKNRRFCVTKLHWLDGLDGTWHIQTGTCLQTQWIQMIKLDCWSQYGYDLRSQLKVWWVHGFSNFHWGLLQTIATVVATSGPKRLKQCFWATNLSPSTDWSARSLQSWMLMSWAKGSDPGDVGGKHQLVHWFTSGYSLVNFFPLPSRFRIFQEVPASAAAVPGFGWGGLWKLDGTCCGSLCRVQAGGEVFGEDLWVVAQVPPRQLVPYFLWCPLPAEMGKVWVGNKCQTCNMHTSSYIVLSIIMIDMRDVYAVKDYVALAGRLC